MGTAQSVRVVHDDDDEQDDENSNEDEEEKEEEESDTDIHNNNEDENDAVNPTEPQTHSLITKKILQQEPEMLPCHASASPLSPQLSSLGTPRLGPSIKVWDPYNVLAPPPPPPPPPPPVFSRSFSMEYDRAMGNVLEVFVICNGESELSLRGEFVGGRCPAAGLTGNGKRQARALAVLLNSQGVRFNEVYASPLDRARSMAALLCQEMNFNEDQIQTSDALTDMSYGHWEGCHRSEVYTSEVLSLIEGFQPDVCAPSGESLREVEFRMVQFLNRTVLRLPEKLRTEYFFNHQNESQGFTHHNLHVGTNSIHDRDGPSLSPAHWDLLQRHRPGLSRKKSGKSRLQYVTSTGDHEVDDELSPQDTSHNGSLNDLSIRSSSSGISSCVAIFTHSVPIKCLLTGLLGCSPAMSHKFVIDDSSVTVLQHSLKTGWQIKRMNDTAHLRLL